MRADVSARDGRLEELQPLATPAENSQNIRVVYQSTGAFQVQWLLASLAHFNAGREKNQSD